MPVGERFIIADDGTCTLREFCDFVADCMKVPKPKSVPGFIVRTVPGKPMRETITMNCRVCNAKAIKLLDWKLVFPTLRAGLPATLFKPENPDHPDYPFIDTFPVP